MLGFQCAAVRLPALTWLLMALCATFRLDLDYPLFFVAITRRAKASFGALMSR